MRPLALEDWKMTQRWRNDLEIIELAQLVHFPKTKEMEIEWFNQVLHDKSNRNIIFGIDEIETGKFIGIIQLINIDYISGTGVWGFIIGDTNDRGKGYGLEVPLLFFDYVFNFINIRKVTGYPIASNRATLRMHDKIGGFIEEGCLKRHVYYNDKYHNVKVLSLFKEDFNKLYKKI